ncbi:MAG: twin-arginine translocase subunit TatC [Solirubrobacteraceae bacterium]|nr:twin-arginine translocase subunit TatC [Solirubrobacteraceae bacterium]
MARRIAPIAHEEQLTLVDHLDELRSRLFSSLIFVTLVFAVTFWQSDRVLGVITAPIDNALSTNKSEDDKKLDADEVQYAYQAAVAQAIEALRADTDDLSEAVGALSTSEAVDADEELKRSLAALQAQIAKREAQIEKLDLAAPAIDRRPVTLGVTEPFLVTIRSSLYAALLFSMPFLLYQAYAFIIPAFTPREKQVAVPLMFMVPFLFLGGVAFAYYLVLPQAANFLLNFNDNEFDIQVQGREAVSFVTTFLIGVGLMFQLPVGILAVNRSGIISVDQLRKGRRYAIVVFAILAAVLTPTPDPGTMLLALTPLVVLYELSIIAASWLERYRPLESISEQQVLDDLAEFAPLPLDDDD